MWSISLRWQLLAWGTALGLCWLGLQGYIAEWQPDLALCEGGWLLLAPIVWKLSALWFGNHSSSAANDSQGARRRSDVVAIPGENAAGSNIVPGTAVTPQDWLTSLLIGGLAIGMCWATGAQMAHLPPAYHDEYSYLFATELMAQGQWTTPSSSVHPELFDQYHVLNEGRMASRYYPGTAVWLLPWWLLGIPYFGHYFATGISAVLLYWIGKELQGRATGALAGVSFALSPGVPLFANLLLAHQPTLVGLMIFLWGFCRGVRTGRIRDFLISGVGLSGALLCRPATAIGVGLPFGIWCIGQTWSFYQNWRIDRGTNPPLESIPCPDRHEAFRLVPNDQLSPSVSQTDKRFAIPRRCVPSFWIGYGVPLLVTIAVALLYHQTVTGSWRTSPYQSYTDIYTPRHVYGFNNVVRGERQLGPKVLNDYDRWAENLTPALANRNLLNRTIVSALWTIGLPLMAMTLVVSLSLLRSSNPGWACIFWAVIALHAIHWPYWYAGIMGWHYVFESSALWCLLMAGACSVLARQWALSGQQLMTPWLLMLLLWNWSGAYLELGPEWPSRWLRGVESIRFPRIQHAEFLAWTNAATQGERVLLLIDPATSNPHLDLVLNSPGLDRQILYGRWRPGQTDLAAVIRDFPDRRVLIVQPELRQLVPAENFLSTSVVPAPP